MNALVEELSNRWDMMFGALARGEDLPPSARLRAEGMMEAAVLLDIASAAQLHSLMASSYQASVGSSLEKDFGEDWGDFYPFPQIPAVARRAPVYPSTKD
jgi:hypothetical protein